MEQFINKAEIKGRVGYVHISEEPDGKVAELSVSTEEVYKNRDGLAFTKMTWHNVSAWNREGVADIDTISKGDIVHVTGKMRVNTKNNDHCYTEIVADKLEILA